MLRFYTLHPSPRRSTSGSCLKAICHLCMQQNLGDVPLLWSDGHVISPHGFRMPVDHEFRVLYCATNEPLNLDITSLSSSDRIWLAHVFTYPLHTGYKKPPFNAFVIDFFRICLGQESPTRLKADCLLLAGMLVGLKIDRRCLAKVDKK